MNERKNGDLMTLRYFGPERHADWCVGPPEHEGFCLDLLLSRVLDTRVDDESS